jgi:hypothetical protein
VASPAAPGKALRPHCVLLGFSHKNWRRRSTRKASEDRHRDDGRMRDSAHTAGYVKVVL